MKAFVTGSTGLLGSNLVNALVATGYEVVAPRHRPSEVSVPANQCLLAITNQSLI